MNENLSQAELLSKIEAQKQLQEQRRLDTERASTTPDYPTENKVITPQEVQNTMPNNSVPPSEEQKPSGTMETNNSLKNRIQALEQELEGAGGSSSSNRPQSAFLDEFGEETFYVKNISNGHVVISDLEDIGRIQRGMAVDLLKFGSIKDLRKSRDLRVALHGQGGRTLLKQLTPEEYFQEKQKEVLYKKEVEAIKSGEPDENEDQSTRIRPVVLGNIEKLNLSTKKGFEHKGMAPSEFTAWALSENLSDEEMDFIIGSVTDKNIRMALNKKRMSQ